MEKSRSRDTSSPRKMFFPYLAFGGLERKRGKVTRGEPRVSTPSDKHRPVVKAMVLDPHPQY